MSIDAADPSGKPALPGERLQKLLSRAGIASRRKAEGFIEAGRVTVNGRVAKLGDRAEPGDDVRLDGRPVPQQREHVSYLLNKPPGVVCSVSDEHGRRTVLDLLPDVPGLHPVGRLDMDSEGLLVVSTDGDLTLRLSHPRYGHEKEYRLWCEQGTVDKGALMRLRSGVELEDGPARALKARSVDGGCVLVLGEGRNRQARRMLEAVGYRVRRLRRTRLGSLRLGDLPLGHYRKLDEDEVAALRSG
ncbi:MAG TPA: pseudouridine synthase [Trueperaceae bacterium]|nr:pseudouridine synthase [Trueperaceae bacterium]